VKEYTESLKAL